VRTPASWSWDGSVGSDARKSFWAQLNAHADGARDGSYTHTLGLQLTARPRSNLQLSAGPSVTRLHDHTQYVTALDDPTATLTYGRRYVFADLEQRTFALETRADWTLTSRLSFQLYLQPFIASGDYHDYHALAAARTRDYTPYAWTGGDPDFNFRSVRGSAVLRWEFRPGSALYVAWNENRADVAPFGDFRLRRDLRAIPTAPSHDVFLVKFSYWLPLYRSVAIFFWFLVSGFQLLVYCPAVIPEETFDERALAKKYGVRELVFPDSEHLKALTAYLSGAVESGRSGPVPKVAVQVMLEFLQGVLNRQHITKGPRMSDKEFDALQTPYYLAARIVTKLAREKKELAEKKGKIYQTTYLSLVQFIDLLRNIVDPGCYWMRVGKIPEGVLEVMEALWDFVVLYPEARKKGRAL
jgi:hypothetical protein